VVCTVTGHGLKDPDTAIADVALRDVVSADVDVVSDVLGYA